MAGTLMNDDDGITGINVTPLVDIVLVILIIFIVTASFMLKSGIPVELPSAQTGQEQTENTLLTVAIDGQGGVFLNGRRASLEAIPGAVADVRGRLATAGSKNPVSAFISADVSADYGRFAAVVDRLRLEGVVDIALDTQPVQLSAVDAAP